MLRTFSGFTEHIGHLLTIPFRDPRRFHGKSPRHDPSGHPNTDRRGPRLGVNVQDQASNAGIHDVSSGPDAELTAPESAGMNETQSRVPRRTSSVLLRRLARRREKLQSLRTEVLQLRIRLDYARETLAGAARHYQDSQERLASLVNHSSQVSSSATPRSEEIDGLLQELSNRGKTFTQQLEETRNLETALSGKETRLAKREGAWLDSLSRITSALRRQFTAEGRLDGQDEGGSLHSTPSVSTLAHETEMPELLVAYYKKLEDVGYFAERLGDLETEYQEATVERQLRVDREQSLDETDSAFERRYAREGAELEESLTRATQAAENLRQQCKAAGIVVEGDADDVHEATGILLFSDEADYERFSSPGNASPASHATEKRDALPDPPENTWTIDWSRVTKSSIPVNDGGSPGHSLGPDGVERIQRWREVSSTDPPQHPTSTPGLIQRSLTDSAYLARTSRKTDRSLSHRRTGSLDFEPSTSNTFETPKHSFDLD